MQLTLYYRGVLPSNGNARTKQKIRDVFHPQIKALFDQPPLDEMAEHFLDCSHPEPEIENGLIQCVGESDTFVACLVTSGYHTTASLEITVLRPEPPGSILSQSGDIDNRLKTLLDALTAPSENQLKESEHNATVRDPMFCLLEDDKLVTAVLIKTEQLLEPSALESREVVVLVRVETAITRTTFNNLVFS